MTPAIQTMSMKNYIQQEEQLVLQHFWVNITESVWITLEDAVLLDQGCFQAVLIRTTQKRKSAVTSTDHLNINYKQHSYTCCVFCSSNYVPDTLC